MDRIGVKGGALVSTLVSGALVAGALSAAPTANATCASFFGIGNSANCKSNLTSIAIAIGPNAKALADFGYFGVSLSVGADAVAFTPGIFTVATAVGDNAQSVAGGFFSIATTLGANGVASAGGQGLNIALNVTPATTVPNGSGVVADGFGNVGVNLFGSGTDVEKHLIRAAGILNTSVNLGGTDNKVWAGEGSDVLNGAFNALGSGNFVATGGGGGLNLAFKTFGNGNLVIAGPGPVAIAGSILQNGQPTTKSGPGFNINGFKVGGAAAVAPKKTAAPSATAHASGRKAAASGAGHSRRSG